LKFTEHSPFPEHRKAKEQDYLLTLLTILWFS
jgi:hypothetical protein